MTNYRKVWGLRVAEARQAAGLSRQALAVRAGLAYGTIALIEQGKRGAGDETRIAVAAALGVDVNELFAYPEPEPVTAAARVA